MATFEVNGHSAVITHMLVGAGSYIKQRCLATVRIAHKGHIDDILARMRSHDTICAVGENVTVSR